MDAQTIMHIRAVMAKMTVHAAHNAEERAVLADTFDLYEEDLDALHDFSMWVQSHGLEYAWEAYEAHKRDTALPVEYSRGRSKLFKS